MLGGGGGFTTFNATFNFSPQHIVLPGVVVYGVTLQGMINDCLANASNYGLVSPPGRQRRS